MELTQLERDLFDRHRRQCPCNRQHDQGRDKCGLPNRKPWDATGFCDKAEECTVFYWLHALGFTQPTIMVTERGTT